MILAAFLNPWSIESIEVLVRNFFIDYGWVRLLNDERFFFILLQDLAAFTLLENKNRWLEVSETTIAVIIATSEWCNWWRNAGMQFRSIPASPSSQEGMTCRSICVWVRRFFHCSRPHCTIALEMQLAWMFVNDYTYLVYKQGRPAGEKCGNYEPHTKRAILNKVLKYVLQQQNVKPQLSSTLISLLLCFLCWIITLFFFNNNNNNNSVDRFRGQNYLPQKHRKSNRRIRIHN